MTDAADVLRTVRASQERLAMLVDGYGEAELTGPSYDDDWSVADVLSHLGSQAEIFLLFVDAGIDGTEAPTNDAFGPIWDVWNAKSPTAQARDSLAADRALVDRLEALSADELDRFELDMFGMHLDATMLLRMRLGEHALHTWDIAVVADGTAVLPPDATEVLVDGIGRWRRGRATGPRAAADRRRRRGARPSLRAGHRRGLPRGGRPVRSGPRRRGRAQLGGAGPPGLRPPRRRAPRRPGPDDRRGRPRQAAGGLPRGLTDRRRSAGPPALPAEVRRTSPAPERHVEVCGRCLAGPST